MRPTVKGIGKWHVDGGGHDANAGYILEQFH